MTLLFQDVLAWTPQPIPSLLLATAPVATAPVEEPLGERIGGLIFWPLLIALLGVIVWSLVRARRRSAAQAQAAAGLRAEDYAEHHVVRWDADPSTFTAESRHWPLAVGAVFGICTGDPWDRLAFVKVENPEKGLREAWNITSRLQLLRTLHWLLREGHRLDYQLEVEEWASLSEEDAGRVAERLSGDDTAGEDAGTRIETGWRFRQVRSNERDIQGVRFEAWDLVRAAMLARAGFTLGWLSEAEAVDTLNLIAPDLRRTYSSWAELGEHFLRARWYWGGHTRPSSQREDAHDASRQQALLELETGPWSKVPWELPVPDSRVLLADALVAEDPLTQVPITSPTPLAEVVDEVILERLSGRT